MGRAAQEPVQRGEAVNEVRLCGRWGGAMERSLPSGDVVVSARVIVDRPEGGVDTIDCAFWRAGVRRKALAMPQTALVELVGSLRRRFWRTPTGPASRYEVEVVELRRGGARSRPPTHR